MFERFTGEARTLASEAYDEARNDGSATVESEHLLLALVAHRNAAADVLGSFGLDHASIRAALHEDFVRNLRAAGVSVDKLEPRPQVAAAATPRWATSAKTALVRALDTAKARGDRRIRSGHLLLGLLGAEEGSVPRALREAGIDPADVSAAMGGAMSGAE